MALGTLFSCVNHANAPFKKSIKSMVDVFLIISPIASNKALKLGKKLLD